MYHAQGFAGVLDINYGIMHLELCGSLTSDNDRCTVCRALWVCWTHLEWCMCGTSASCRPGATVCCRMCAWLSWSCHAIASWRHATTLRWKRCGRKCWSSVLFAALVLLLLPDSLWVAYYLLLSILPFLLCVCLPVCFGTKMIAWVF